ncbi:hypothetical protein BDR03DRAFT_938250 [Suillus americanus]|nr:hypothetical protein BDR03DRAFT_938250 [Suillus americanus]
MRFSLFLVVVVAALTALVYASDAAVEGCPFECNHDSDCKRHYILDLTTRLTSMD